MARTLKQLQAEQKAEVKRLEIIEKQNNSLKTQRSMLDGRTKAAKDYDKALKMSNVTLAKHEEKLKKLTDRRIRFDDLTKDEKIGAYLTDNAAESHLFPASAPRCAWRRVESGLPH